MNYNEKSTLADVETADNNNTNNGDILTPLLLLLAARRGFQHDSNIAHIDVPDGYTFTYRGKSGVQAINHSSRFVRFMCFNGYRPMALLVPFIMASFTFIHTTMGLIYEAKSYRWNLGIAAILTAVEVLYFIYARFYAKRHAATATPPSCDPDSYQCRLSVAMAKANIQYTEIVSATLAEMEKLWKSEQAVCERFRIKGLADPEDRGLVYDVVMRFYNSGGIIIQFPSAEAVPAAKHGILIEKVADGKS